MKTIKYYLLLILLIAIQSCNDPDEPGVPIIPLNNNFTYPLQIGNEWSVSSSTIFNNIRPDSIKHLLTNYFTSGKLTVTNDTLLDSLNVWELTEKAENNMYSRTYYANTDTGFINYAYSNGPHTISPKLNYGHQFLFKGNRFNSIEEIVLKLEVAIDLFKSTNDTLYYHHPPRIVYQYPLSVGKGWVFSLEFIKIDKEVIGKETVYTNAGGFECFKILWKYDLNSDGITDDDIIYHEYVSSKGVIKSIITIKDITITNEQHPEGIGFTDVRMERVLTGINF